VFRELKAARAIAPGVRFQVCIPSPIAPVYNNMLPADRPAVLAALMRHFVAEVERIADAIPPESLAIQWDVCQEVLAWEGYYEPGPVEFETETVETLATLAAAVPEPVELGFHLCYGSPHDEHLVQPKDAGVMVRLINAVAERAPRPIDFVHFPVPKARSDSAYFEPFAGLQLDAATERYLGLIHYRDAAGDRQRLAAARRFLRVDGVATECGMGRGDPARLTELVAAHAALARGD
jgi:methionine synthase II (cobalamin-independent)